MATELLVVNEALVELGQTPIAALSGTDSLSVACQTIYADTRDAVLLLHPWKFATFQQSLTLSSNPPVFKWAHQYPLPDGAKYSNAPYCLKVLTTSEGTGGVWDLANHATDGRILYAHPLGLGGTEVNALATQPYAIEYTGRVTDLSQWDALAVRILVKLLASNLAKSQTGQTALGEEKLKEALALLAPAQKEQEAQGAPVGLFPPVEAVDSSLRVVNQALARIGKGPIHSLNEDTAEGYQARVNYQTAQASVLTRHPWNFAKCQATLALSASYQPSMKWRYAYDLPDGSKYGAKPYCLAVQGVDGVNGEAYEVANDTTAPATMGVTSGKVLLTDSPSATIEYTGLIANLGIWSSPAIEALNCTLAARMAYALTQDAKLGVALDQEAMGHLQEAKRLDGREGTPFRLRPNRILTQVRYSYGSYAGWGTLWMPPVPTQPTPREGRAFGLAQATLQAVNAVDGGARLVAMALLPAGTRISKVVYHCDVSFGTSQGLTSVDIGEATLQDRWGHQEGIVFGTTTGYGYGLASDLEVRTNGDVWVTANGGLFDTVGACTLYALWEIPVLN